MRCLEEEGVIAMGETMIFKKGGHSYGGEQDHDFESVSTKNNGSP